MSPSSRQTETSMQSLEAIRGTTPPNLRTHPSTGIPEADSERGSGTTSSLPHSVRHVNSFQRELPFTMQRWLADTDTSRLITRLVNCTQSPDDMCPPDQEDGDVPAAITDILGKQSTHAAGKTLPSSADRTMGGDWDISLREVGAWCSEDDLRKNLSNECTCQAAQELVAVAKVLRYSLRDLGYVSVRIRNVLSDMEMTKLPIPE